MKHLFNLIFFFILFCVGILIPGHAQEIKLNTTSKKAIKHYNEAESLIRSRKIPEAINSLKQSLNADPTFPEGNYRIGTLYIMQNDKVNARIHFEKVLANKVEGKNFEPAYLALGELYFQEVAYEKAADVLRQFLTFKIVKAGIRQEAELLLKSAEFSIEAIKKPLDFKPQPMDSAINSQVLQYFPVLTADQETIFFTARKGARIQEDENIMVSVKKAGEWQMPQPISPNINTPYNEGTCTISADGRTLIFTSCEGRPGFGSCDLFITKKIGDDWAKPVNLGENINTGFWESQPSLSADGRTLYFVSDRKGGFGRNDIWVSTLDKKGNWTKARNLGDKVNTPLDEISPYIHVNGQTLFFSSKGYPGLGGYDLFYTNWEDSSWTEPTNLGYPINNFQDQVSLFISASGDKGYYTNEVKTNKNFEKSQIYHFDIPSEIQVKYRSNFVKGEVYDAETKNKLNANIDLIDLRRNKIISSVSSDAVTGQYLMVLTDGAQYGLFIKKAGYMFKSLSFDYSEKHNLEPLIIDIALDPVKPGAMVVLNNIFFDIGKWDIRDNSKAEMETVIEFMKENPGLKFEISGHTDSDGSDEANMELSLKRAQAVHKYLLDAGVKKEIISFAGYGEKHPRVPNTTDENKQLNRRIEFKVM